MEFGSALAGLAIRSLGAKMQKWKVRYMTHNWTNMRTRTYGREGKHVYRHTIGRCPHEYLEKSSHSKVVVFPGSAHVSFGTLSDFFLFPIFPPTFSAESDPQVGKMCHK